jgi:hypothetical protein
MQACLCQQWWLHKEGIHVLKRRSGVPQKQTSQRDQCISRDACAMAPATGAIFAFIATHSDSTQAAVLAMRDHDPQDCRQLGTVHKFHV